MLEAKGYLAFNEQIVFLSRVELPLTNIGVLSSVPAWVVNYYRGSRQMSLSDSLDFLSRVQISPLSDTQG